MGRKTLIILFGIIFLASILRFWQLGQVPPSPDWDEAALGYNSYSIMQTGRDEYGKFLPVVLRSFDDYKPALYAYLIIPFIKLFDLNIISVRLPSAIFGVLTVVATYFLITELFRKREAGDGKIALLTSFLLAISPWHIQFSRIAFESNIGVAFNVFSVLFFLKGLKNHFYLVVSAVLMAINIYVYQSEKVFTPILLIILVLIYRKQLFSLPRKYIIMPVILGLIIILPMINYIMFNKEALTRAKGVSIFSDQTPFLKENVQRIIDDKKNNDITGLILDNRRILYGKAIVSGYLSHFDFNWLFIKGDIVRHHAPGMGLMYLFELPFLLIGVYYLIFGAFDKKTKIFILSWILIAPIPASITSGVPHAVRTLNFLPMFQVIIAVGILGFVTSMSNIKNQSASWRTKIQIKYLIFTMCFLFLIFNISYYLNQYFAQQNYYNSQDWQYGYKEAVSELKPIEDKYDKIIVTNKPYLDQSYMFFLFYLKYSPSLYQKEAQISSGGFKENHIFGKFEFRPIQWDKEEKSSRILYIGTPSDFPNGSKVIKTINFLDQQPAIKIVEGQ